MGYTIFISLVLNIYHKQIVCANRLDVDQTAFKEQPDLCFNCLPKFGYPFCSDCKKKLFLIEIFRVNILYQTNLNCTK